MTDDATPASSAPSKPQTLEHVPGATVIERMAAYREQNPEATEYSLSDETEAGQLLQMMADQIRAAMQLREHRRDRRRLNEMRQTEHAMRRAFAEGRALHYIQSLAHDDELEIYGMKLVVPAVLLRQ